MPSIWTAANKYGKRFLEVGLVLHTYVGTDPNQFEDLRPYALTRQLAPYVLPPFKGKAIVPTGALYETLQIRIPEVAIAKLKLSPEEDDQAARVSRVSGAAASGSRLQGGAARWRVGHAAVHAQRIGPQPVRNAASGQAAIENVLHRA